MQNKTLIYFIFFCGVLALVILFLFKNKNTKIDSQRKGKEEFLKFLVKKKNLPLKEAEVSLIAVGDISYSRGVESEVKKYNDVNYPLLKIRDYLRTADLVFGNLESPITKGPEIPDFVTIFRSNPGVEKALKEAGFSILSLANNHTPDFGEKGLKDTFEFLKKAGIKYVGAGINEEEAYSPVYIERKGIKFVFLAYNDIDVVSKYYEASKNRAGTAFMRVDKMIQAVKKAKKNSDFVIVSMHSGTEYINKPNESQVRFAHSAIDAGADLVIGHHPHVVQTMEKYKGKFIFYSLGNFIFDQPQRQDTREGLMIKVYFTKSRIKKISFLPFVMENLAQPRIANEKESERILNRLNFPLSTQDVFFWDDYTHIIKKKFRKAIYISSSKYGERISKQRIADVDSNSIPENYILRNGRLTIIENDKIIWQSPEDWWIDNFVLADSTHDGIIDINISLWKPGNFGSSKPFWVKENDMSVRNHFFILNIVRGIVKEVWGSSNLSFPNCEFEIDDIDMDGKNELIVIEGDYSLKPKCKGNFVAIWKWKDWGFFNEWRSEKGNFSDLEIESIGGKKYIVVDNFN